MSYISGNGVKHVSDCFTPTWPPPLLSAQRELTQVAALTQAPQARPTAPPDSPPKPPAVSLPTADTPGVHCTRCGSREFVDVQIHKGASVRRDCARCKRFIDFPVWYGREPGGRHARAMALVGVAGIRLAADLEVASHG